MPEEPDCDDISLHHLMDRNTNTKDISLTYKYWREFIPLRFGMVPRRSLLDKTLTTTNKFKKLDEQR